MILAFLYFRKKNDTFRGEKILACFLTNFLSAIVDCGVSLFELFIIGIGSIVFFTNVGSSITSYSDSSRTSIVGVGTTFIDNVYKVVGVTTVIGDAVGVGQTTLTRVTVSVSNNSISSGSSDFYTKLISYDCCHFSTLFVLFMRYQ